MAVASDNRRREIATSNMAAIEHAQKRLETLHNEMDLIQESGEGSPPAEPERYQKIPKLIGDGNISPQRTADHMAAIESQKKTLYKAQTYLWDAEHLLDILGVYLGEVESDECHRANMLVGQVEKAVGKALERIERHETDYGNLFIAYCEQKRKGAEGGSA